MKLRRGGGNGKKSICAFNKLSKPSENPRWAIEYAISTVINLVHRIHRLLNSSSKLDCQFDYANSGWS